MVTKTPTQQAYIPEVGMWLPSLWTKMAEYKKISPLMNLGALAEEQQKIFLYIQRGNVE